MSLLRAGPGRALVFDREAALGVLASGFPSALSPGGSDSGAGAGPIHDFEYVFAHPEEVRGPASFLSASNRGLVVLGELLSDSNAYFVTQSEALHGVIQPDLGNFPGVAQPTRASFSFDGGAPVLKDLTPPKFPWMQWVDTSSSDSSALPSQ